MHSKDEPPRRRYAKPAARRTKARWASAFLAKKLLRIGPLIIIAGAVIGHSLAGSRGATAIGGFFFAVFLFISAPFILKALFKDGRTALKHEQAVRETRKRREAHPVAGSVSIAGEAEDGALSPVEDRGGAISEPYSPGDERPR